MSPEQSLGEIFLDELGRTDRDTVHEIAKCLAELYAKGQAAWPQLQLTPEAFARHLAARLATEDHALDALQELHASDLYLACACVEQEGLALEAFESRFGPPIVRALGPFRLASDAMEEVRQLLRHHLLLPRQDAPPRLASYSGRGPLAGWVQVAASRFAIDFLRSQKHRRGEMPVIEELLPTESVDPELEYARSHYGADLKMAFRSSFAALTPRERTVLRLYIIDGFNIDRIALVHRVHRATAARWIAQARAKLLEETQRRIQEALKLDSDAAKSLVALLRSRFDITLHSVLDAR